MNVSELNRAKAEIDSGGRPVVTVRELLGWFGAKRRGSWVVHYVHGKLREAGLATDPDFQYEYIDAPVAIVPRAVPADGAAGSNGQATPPSLAPQATGSRCMGWPRFFASLRCQ